MRKKLETRFPAARIKRIMQADEEVGKIAMATPVLISKALELFLQDLCDRTYDITLKRGAKTMNSHHLKECVHSHSVFDFLRETVSRVPDLEVESAGVADNGRPDNGRRRKAVDGENDESGEEDSKRSKSEIQATTPRGRGRGRGRGRRSNNEKTRTIEPYEKHEDTEAGSSPQHSDDSEASPKSHANEMVLHLAQSCTTAKDSADSSRNLKNFDLNMDPDENGEVSAIGKDAEHQSHWLGAGYSGLIPMTLQEEPEEDYDCEDED